MIYFHHVVNIDILIVNFCMLIRLNVTFCMQIEEN